MDGREDGPYRYIGQSNQMRLFGITVQDNPVCESQLYIMGEDVDFVLPLQRKATNVTANTRTPTAQELHDCTHIVLLSKHPWDPHRVRFPESSCTVQEEMEMQRSIGGVRVSCAGVSWEEPTNEKLSEAEIFNMDCVLSRLISASRFRKSKSKFKIFQQRIRLNPKSDIPWLLQKT